MIKFTSLISSLLILAAPNSCLSGNETPASSGASTSSVDVNALTLPEKIKHFEALTTIVESLAGSIKIGEPCLAHQLLLTGPLGDPKTGEKTEDSKKRYEGAAVASNSTEALMHGMLSAYKGNIYILKQIVDTSKVVVEGLTALAPTEPAAPAAPTTSNISTALMFAGEGETAVPASAPSFTLTEAQTAKITELRGKIQTVLKENFPHAMATLAPIETLVFSFASGMDSTNGAMKKSGEESKRGGQAAIDEAAKQVLKIATDTSAMIEAYFTLLGGDDEVKKLTFKKAKMGLGFAGDDATNGAEKAVDYKKAFVTYVTTVAPDETTLKAAKEDVARATNDKQGKLLKTAMDAYIEKIGDDANPNKTTSTAGDQTFCGRKATEVLIQAKDA